MSLIAFGNSILVEDYSEEKKTTGGIILPKDVETQDVSKVSRVVSIAEEAMIKMTGMGVRPIKVGDLVYHRYFSGTEMFESGSAKEKPEFRHLKLEDILAVVYKD